MKNIILIICTLSLIYSCGNKIETIEETTTELITEMKYNESTSISKSYRNDDIIDVLYNEVLDNNKNLKQLDAEIRAIMSDSLSDKTDKYLKYKRINGKYRLNVKNYINQIKDSLTKIHIERIFDIDNEKYNKAISNHEIKMNDIYSLKSELDDKIILMKLFVTKPLFEKYQKNELPNIEELESLIKDYKNAIEQTERYVPKR